MRNINIKLEFHNSFISLCPTTMHDCSYLTDDFDCKSNCSNGLRQPIALEVRNCLKRQLLWQD